jgi:hypothetical protein
MKGSVEGNGKISIIKDFSREINFIEVLFLLAFYSVYILEYKK